MGVQYLPELAEGWGGGAGWGVQYWGPSVGVQYLPELAEGWGGGAGWGWGWGVQ